MSEPFTDDLQRDAVVDQLGGVAMPQLVHGRGDAVTRNSGELFRKPQADSRKGVEIGKQVLHTCLRE